MEFFTIFTIGHGNRSSAKLIYNRIVTSELPI